MTQRASSSNRLWAGVLVLAVLVIAVLVFDPFAADDSDPLMDGLNDAPFVAVLQRDEVPEVEPDEVLDKVEEVDGVESDGEATTGPTPVLSDDQTNRGNRVTSD